MLDRGGGIRIKINKEYRVLNHLEEKPENTNLLFYNFNAYNENEPGVMDRERVPTRGMRSRREFKERQIQSAASQNRNFFIAGSNSNTSTATNSINT